MSDGYGQHPDDVDIDKIAQILKDQMATERSHGRVLWRDTAKVSAESLALDLRRHSYRGDTLMVAMVAVQLLIRGQAITRVAPPMDMPLTHDKLINRLDGFTGMDEERDAMERRGRAERRAAPR